MSDKNEDKLKGYKKSNKRVFFDDLPYAHMYVKDDDGRLVKLVETQPLSYLVGIVTNIEQTKEAVLILTDLTETLLDNAKEQLKADNIDATILSNIQASINQILDYKGEISKLTKSAPADIDTIKTLIDRLLKDAQEEARILIGERPMSYRENALDISDKDAPDIIRMED